MEMGSGSLTESGGSSTNSSAESLNGLKFGKKIYFEDTAAVAAAADGGGKSVGDGANIGTPSKSGPGSPSLSGSGRKARVDGMAQGVLRPRCQVEGCKVDLNDDKAYYSRHKVCCMHSKSSKVIVAGLEQRFCQQCSRFHQLSEFDKGKRSCRRRLAGHNERRRKPPPGSLFSSPYGGLSSSIIENGSRGGSFIVDFSAYPRLSGSDAWPAARSVEYITGNRNTATGSSFSHPWQNDSNKYPHEHFLQGSTCGTSFSSTGISPGECFTGSGDSSCALSLLSNQPWGSRNQALNFSVNGVTSTEGSSAAQPTPPHGAVVNPYPNASLDFNGNDTVRSSYKMLPHLDLGQIPDPVNCQFSSDLELSQQSWRSYMEHEQSRAAYDDSMQHIHWTL
ncbi:hypothetical protein J1N35_040966 [Gossypium stocksii]|uniref:SBP-type domain-containing protein n=1 Tax=Gossypium stocksii TaxID=47602 RepID=A0A9D3ZIZ9_9ROSI|nr:hypothetical protein J1N35_040966 [Gossypium stocksii]